MYGELISRYLTATVAIKRGLRSRGGPPMAGLLPTTCHPGSRGGCARPTPRRAAASLRYAKHTERGEDPLVPRESSEPLRNERKNYDIDRTLVYF